MSNEESILQKENINTAATTTDTDIFSYYEKNITNLTDEATNELKHYLKTMDKELIKLIIDEAVNNNVKTLNYVKAILLSCNKEKIYTVEQFKKRHEAFIKKRKTKAENNSKMDQRQYPDDFLNSLYANVTGAIEDDRNTT